MVDLDPYIRDVPDFPKAGILFKDITPLLRNPDAFRETLDRLAAIAEKQKPDALVGIESRGFIFGAALAARMGIGFVPVRKPGKLPADTVKASYELEYGTDSIEMHKDALKQGERAVLVDDLLATGGTMEACCRLVESVGATVTSCCFVIELAFLEGRKKLEKYPVHALIRF